MNTICIAGTGGTLVIRHDELVHVQADGSYCHLWLQDGRHHVVSRRIGMLETELPRQLFTRCHDSHIINVDKVKRVITVNGVSVELTNGKLIPVSRRRYAYLLLVLRGGGG